MTHSICGFLCKPWPVVIEKSGIINFSTRSHQREEWLVSTHRSLSHCPSRCDCLSGSDVCNIETRLSSRSEFTSIVCKTRAWAVPHVVKDGSHGLFCLYKEFNDPWKKKKWIHKYRGRDGVRVSMEQYNKKEDRASETQLLIVRILFNMRQRFLTFFNSLKHLTNSNCPWARHTGIYSKDQL